MSAYMKQSTYTWEKGGERGPAINRLILDSDTGGMPWI